MLVLYAVWMFRPSSCTLSEFVYMNVYAFMCYTGRATEREIERERERQREGERERGRKELSIALV